MDAFHVIISLMRFLDDSVTDYLFEVTSEAFICLENEILTRFKILDVDWF
ncbi:hypothetical protein HMPREF0530_2560 [Lacticaseibacillus paracasei subsp. paracasei ATCC 25302 = DSM 5622 = JCM 8130]|nr:hypothetical protein HMPREF0530_2560 [Lacticaseibacillus paracasei subsp. paracasei ATCC 25302 = DSM 5622 = JCM 8130]